MITTAIPTFRRPRLLARAIRSVLAQTYSDFQLVVYDNASNDETAEVVAEFANRDHRVHYRAQPQHLDVLANFNAALGGIETDYFSLLSDDDVLLPYFYEQAIASFTAHPAAIFVASPVMLVNEGGRVLTTNNRDWPPGLQLAPAGMVRIAKGEHFIWTGTLFRRQALETGSLDLETGGCADLDFFLRIAGRHAIAVADRPGAVFSVHPDSPSSYPRLSLYWPTWVRIIANAGHDASIPLAARTAVQHSLEKRLARLLFRVSIFSSSRGYATEARQAVFAFRSRYRDPGRAALMLFVAVACERAPIVRSMLHATISWVRWRRGPIGREQRILDQYPSLLLLDHEVTRKDAAA